MSQECIIRVGGISARGSMGVTGAEGWELRASCRLFGGCAEQSLKGMEQGGPQRVEIQRRGSLVHL